MTLPMAVPASQEEIRKAQEQRRARMAVEAMRRRFAGFVLSTDNGTTSLKPAVHCQRDLPPSAA